MLAKTLTEDALVKFPPATHTGSAFLLGFAILFPAVNYFLYYSVIAFFVGLEIIVKLPTSKRLYIYSALILFFAIISLPKIVFYASISDIKEFGKLILFLALCVLVRVNPDMGRVKSILFVVILIDFLFTILQWISFDHPLLSFYQSFLHTENHIQGSLNITSVRGLGIFADTAEHASVILIIYCFFLSQLRHRLSPGQSALSVALCVMLLLLTQSKTGIIALVFSIPLALYCAAQFFSKLSLTLFICALATFAVSYISDDAIQKFEQLYYLYEYGFELSSFKERQMIWAQVIATSLNSNPLLILFGAGRGALEESGLQSSVFDNDLVYLLNAYGVFGILMFISAYFIGIKKLNKFHSPRTSWLFYVLLLMPIIGFATDFISSLKPLVVIGLIFANATYKSGIVQMNRATSQ